jgi:hypothetical protein
MGEKDLGVGTMLVGMESAVTASRLRERPHLRKRNGASRVHQDQARAKKYIHFRLFGKTLQARIGRDSNRDGGAWGIDCRISEFGESRSFVVLSLWIFDASRRRTLSTVNHGSQSVRSNRVSRDVGCN